MTGIRQNYKRIDVIILEPVDKGAESLKIQKPGPDNSAE